MLVADQHGPRSNIPKGAATPRRRPQSPHLFAGVLTITGDDTIPGTEKDMQATLQHLRALTMNAACEMHKIMFSAGAQALGDNSPGR